MANTQLLRSFVCDRLSAAAEEIFAFVERTMIEYEVDILRSKREIHRQRKLLDIALNPQPKLKRTETKNLSDNQHCAVELSLNLSQHHTKPQGHIKEEHEELITSHVGEQLQELEQLDAVTSRSTSTYIPSGGDQPEPLQSAHLFQTIKVEETDSQLHAESVKESSGTYTIVDSTCGIQVLPAPIPERSTGTSNCTSGIVDWMGSSQASSNIVKVRSRRNRQRKAVLGRDALGRRTYKCPLCAKSFNSSGAFSKHLDMHEGVRYQCPHCGKTFGRTDHLKTHMFIHAGVKPFSCMECGKCFRLKTGLKEHIKTHTGDRPFPCGVCGKRFFSASDHKRHQRSHTGEKPYMCSVCNKSFRYTTDVKRHMSNFHPANLKD